MGAPANLVLCLDTATGRFTVELQPQDGSETVFSLSMPHMLGRTLARAAPGMLGAVSGMLPMLPPHVLPMVQKIIELGQSAIAQPDTEFAINGIDVPEWIA